MAREVTIEVLVQQGSRWQIHSQYTDAQKDAAIEEAKALGKVPGIENVRVVREVYDTESGVSADSTLYKSPPKEGRGAAATPAARGNAASGGGWSEPPRTMRSANGDDDDLGAADIDVGDDEEKAPRRKRRPRARAADKKTGAVGAIVKLLLVTLISIGLAAAFTVFLAESLPHSTMFGVSFVGDGRANALFIAFVVAFLATSIPLARSVLRKVDLSSGPVPQPAVRRPVPAKPSKPAKKERKKKEPTEPDLALIEEKEEKPEKKKHEKEEAFVPPEPVVQEPDEPEPTTLSPETEKQKVYMMKFLGDGLRAVQARQQKMDNVSKFGVNLFLAGASEALSHGRNLEEGAAAAILSDSVQVLGFKKAQADAFAAKADEYLVTNPKYLRMYEAGRNSMNAYLAGDAEDGAKGLVKALDDWNAPKSQETTGGLLTVMFTDIAGSTAMTQTLGDAGAQKVVRVHNRIVRQSLAAFAGKEIKHTGDGIMASFSSATNAVDACIDMQRRVAEHNKVDPSLPLHLKIGINAGEPIAEDDDLFGTTVQVAARITDGAKADQIFISEIVRGICVGKNYKFVNRGAYEMKGLDAPLTLFEVIWQEDVTIEQATQRVAAELKAAQAGGGGGKSKLVAPPPHMAEAGAQTAQPSAPPEPAVAGAMAARSRAS